MQHNPQSLPKESLPKESLPKESLPKAHLPKAHLTEDSLQEEHLPEKSPQSLRELASLTRNSVALFWHNCARDLPWRFGRTTPWGVLVCEVMSQQTQMSRVVPYWLTWMQTWPDAQSLAHATSAEIITAWGRLGYPRRALRLQSCAKVVAETYHNKLPRTYEELTALPGVGDYTASAVLSFAYGKHIAVVDTNIRRVLVRAFTGTESHGGSTTQSDRELAAAVLPEDNHSATNATNATNASSATCTSSVWNQAIMEIGATICTAQSPQCTVCPLQTWCRFKAAGFPGLGVRRTRPQQHFAGTNRQVRGIILQALREAHRKQQVLQHSEISNLWSNQAQLGECIASLDHDRLITILPDGTLTLP
ncbi:putative A/G-specific adenine glycosylase [Gardnerella vaginalis JCP8481A]|uniref:A/G-specific adenine glycosylase n=1 Tax=Gardnerella vaginalis TaxID=2702 RepID=UPI00035281AA|nr:A/G-specific adenine glycosylase [Gardnerella vaginalis]EPI41787.1 putative A/G-specific adenine glycosylase [Gardnerella vaginalis JCP8481A]